MPIVNDETIAGLPPPVQRSLRRSDVLGKQVPTRVTVRQKGEILLRDRWLPFTAVEGYNVSSPGFEWKAVVKLAGLPLARADDSLSDRRGRMHVRLLGMFTVVDEVGPEMDQGALMRWLNETMWFPHVWATDVISWKPVDDATALGAVTVGNLRVEAAFCFDSEGRLIDFRGDRYRIGETGPELVRWATPITGHDRFDGIEVPTFGSALWALGEQDLEYIRVQITDIRYT